MVGIGKILTTQYGRILQGRWLLLSALILALISDTLDFFGVGVMPVLGDALDVFTTVILLPIIGPTAFLGLLELIPLADLFPTFLFVIALSRVFPFNWKDVGKIMKSKVIGSGKV